MTRPLDGIKVVEAATLFAAPLASMLLGDFGADIVKIEHPLRPDPARGHGASKDGIGLWFKTLSRNKRLITLSLATPRGRDVFLRLVEGSDVVIENFRPGTLERWNLGYDRLCEANRGLVLARVSGYGQTGPYRHRPGFASVAEAMGGLRAINGFPGQAPPRMAVSLGDSLAGMFAVQGVLAALLHRQRTGQGQMVDVALTESSLALLESVIPEYDRLGKVRQPSGTRLDGIAPSNLFRSKDEKWVIVAANQDTVFRRLCDVMDRPGLADDPRFATHVARGENQELIESIVEDWVRERTADEVLALLEEADVVAGPVYTAADIVADPQFQARDMLVPHHDERLAEDVLGPGVVPRLTGTPGSVRWAGPPEPGWHNDEVYGRLLGLTPQEIAELRAQNVV